MRKISVVAAAFLLAASHLMPVVKSEKPKEDPVPFVLSVPVLVKPKRVIPEHPRKIAERASRAKWNLTEWRCLDMLWTKESHFNPKARNKRSGAYGIAQFMPQTWKNYKVKKTSDPHLQIKYGLRYIEKRYGSPCAAWKHSKRRGWY